MWIMLATGNAMLMVLYCREYYARNREIGRDLNIILNNAYDYNKGSPMDYWSSTKDFFMPRTLLVQLKS